MINRYYADLPPDVRSSIESRGQLKIIPADSQFFVKGERSDGVYALLSGKVEYRMLSPSGKQSLVNIVEEGKWLGDISTLDGGGRTMDCWALEASRFMFLSSRDFLHLFDSHPAFARMLILIQGERLREALGWIEVLTKLGAEGRLAARLLMFSKTRGQKVFDGVKVEVFLTQEIIAEFIGTTRQRVNQILKLWQDQGIIRHDGRYIVLRDTKALEAMLDLA